MVLHDATPVPEHRVAPGVHWSLQVAVQAPPEQTSCAPVQATGVSQSVQPDARVRHVAIPVPEHIAAPSVHWSLQVAVQAPPEQTSCAPVQATGVSQSVQPDARVLHVATPLPEHSAAPGVH
jgi:hypothetical protein